MFSRENGGYKMRFPGRSIQTEDMVFGRGWEETRCPQDFMKWQGLHSWKYPSGGQTTLSRKCLKRGEGTVASWKPLLVLRFRPPGVPTTAGFDDSLALPHALWRSRSFSAARRTPTASSSLPLPDLTWPSRRLALSEGRALSCLCMSTAHPGAAHSTDSP